MTLEARVGNLEKKERTRALADRRAQLRADGYNSSHHDPDCAKYVPQYACEDCGRRTLRYLGGMVRLLPSWSLIAFMQCRSCGWWSEDL